jgi:hypothetical protein
MTLNDKKLPIPPAPGVYVIRDNKIVGGEYDGFEIDIWYKGVRQVLKNGELRVEIRKGG